MRLQDKRFLVGTHQWDGGRARKRGGRVALLCHVNSKDVWKIGKYPKYKFRGTSMDIGQVCKNIHLAKRSKNESFVQKNLYVYIYDDMMICGRSFCIKGQ